MFQMPKGSARTRVDAVVIGRNEGARLVACLGSLAGQVRRVVYVDSGSTDGSVAAARAAGAEVVALDMARPFTAARARNAGLRALAADPPEMVQFLDGDTALRDGWLDRATRFLDENLRAAVVCGRRRERHPEASLWNRLIDAEWDTPVGEARACGGDALMRHDAVASVGGFREDLIAGEEPELCLRLRARGWTIWRIDAEMTWHDADMTRFAQWWRRTERAGHAFAEGADRFSTREAPHWQRETRRALGWGCRWPGCWRVWRIRWAWRSGWPGLRKSCACRGRWAGRAPPLRCWASCPRRWGCCVTAGTARAGGHRG